MQEEISNLILGELYSGSENRWLLFFLATYIAHSGDYYHSESSHLPVKSLFVLGALLMSAMPVNSEGAVASEQSKGYYYGYIYEISNTLCGLIIDQQIKTEEAQTLLSEAVDNLSKDPGAKLYISYADKAYKVITEDVACKEVYQ